MAVTPNVGAKLFDPNEIVYVAEVNDNSTKFDAAIGNRVIKNAPITAATKTKVTYDAKGLVTGGADLMPEDIPPLTSDMLTDIPPILRIDGIPIYAARFVDLDENGDVWLREDGSGEYLVSVLENGIVFARDVVTPVIDNLNSELADEALSARQGSILSGFIGGLSSLLTTAKNSLVGAINEVFQTVVNHIANKSNPHGVTSVQVGLGNVNNTSDANKPVSTAQAAAITAEATARQNADNTLQGSINTLNGQMIGVLSLIPTQATSSNQLADKNFVNSSIQTERANHVYYDANQSNFTTRAAITAATTFYDAKGNAYTPGQNDYTFVNADEGLPAPDTGDMSQWKWDVIAGKFAFDVVFNNTTFTAAQLAALDSGITSDIVSDTAEDIADLQSDVAELETAAASMQTEIDGKNNSPTLYAGDTPLYGTTFCDMSVDGTPIIHEDGGGDYLVSVTILGIPFLRYIGTTVTDTVTGIKYSFTIANGNAILQQIT